MFKEKLVNFIMKKVVIFDGEDKGLKGMNVDIEGTFSTLFNRFKKEK